MFAHPRHPGCWTAEPSCFFAALSPGKSSSCWCAGVIWCFPLIIQVFPWFFYFPLDFLHFPIDVHLCLLMFICLPSFPYLHNYNCSFGITSFSFSVHLVFFHVSCFCPLFSFVSHCCFLDFLVVFMNCPSFFIGLPLVSLSFSVVCFSRDFLDCCWCFVGAPFLVSSFKRYPFHFS